MGREQRRLVLHGEGGARRRIGRGACAAANQQNLIGAGAEQGRRDTRLGDDVAQAVGAAVARPLGEPRSEEPTSELQSLMRTSYAVFCLNKTLITYEYYTP